MTHSRWILAAVTTVLAASAAAQGPVAPAREVKIDDLPPGQRLGARAMLLRDQMPVIPVVVIVPDARSFVEAVAGWTPAGRFPVLMEDGSAPSTEDIARFVRAFKPSSVVRWSWNDPNPDPTNKPSTGQPWPKDAAERRALIEGAVARAWQATPGATQLDMITKWKAAGIVPPGVVFADADDPAWPAAITLAAGHAQPIAWVSAKRGVSQAFTPGEGAEFAASVEKALGSTGLSWRALGDDLDSVTLCLNAPSKISLTPGEPLKIGPGVAKADSVCATTDRVGRHATTFARWGWASQIFGSERQAAYRAMCALFLTMERAWLFDGYPDGKPWSEWDCTLASKALEEGGIKTILDDLPRGGRADWRARASTPLDADLALVNTRGGCMIFDLAPGTARPGDIPLLQRPVVVHMVHSWSLQYPDGRGTVGGCWIERGAYAYFGSVEEPYLGAFLQTPVVAARLAAGFAWGAACRREDAVPWRLACMGDPLITRGTQPRRLHGAAVPLPGAHDLRTTVADLVKAAAAAGPKDDLFGKPLRLLVMLGEDAKVTALLDALSRDKPGQFTLDTAVASMYSLARTGNHELLARAYEKLDEFTAKDANLRDALWVGSIGALPATQDQTLLRQLRRTVRETQPDRDAMDLAPAYGRVFGKPAAVEMLQDVRSRLKDAKQQAELDAYIGTMR